MKYQEMKRQLLTESSILGGVLVVTVAFLWYLTTVGDDYQERSQTLESQVNELATKTNTLRARYNKVRESPLYREMAKKSAGDGFYINRQRVKEGFDTFRNRYHLDNLHLSMSAVTEIKDPKYRRPSQETVASDVDVGFEGVADEYVYGMLSTMDKELPITSKITKFTLQRQGELSPQALRTISEKGSFGLIRGEIKFLWLGIKSLETGESNAHAPK